VCVKRNPNIFITLKYETCFGVFRIVKIRDDDYENRFEGREEE